MTSAVTVQHFAPTYSGPSRKTCLICKPKASLSQSPLVITTGSTAPELASWLNEYFSDLCSAAEYDPVTFCHECLAQPRQVGSMSKVNQFMMSLTLLERRVQELRGLMVALLQQPGPQINPPNVVHDTTNIWHGHGHHTGTGPENSFSEGHLTVEGIITEDEDSISDADADTPPNHDLVYESEYVESGAYEPEENKPTKVAKIKTARKKPASRRPTTQPTSQRRQKRKKSKSDQEPNTPFVCETCGRSFKKDDQLASHRLIHTGEKPFVCKECGKAFRHNPALFLHMKTHTGDRPYKCETCGKAFITKYKLKGHMRVHTLEKPYQCPYCDKTASQNGSITEHVARIHPEHAADKFRPENRYACSSCPKTFLWAGELRIHELARHRLQDRQVQCETCGKKFGDTATYNAHMSRVHLKNRRPPPEYQCTECGKLFRCSKYLAKHAQTHGPQKKWSCDICSRVFTTGKCLLNHQKRHEIEGPVIKPKPRPNRKRKPKDRSGRRAATAAALVEECKTKPVSIRLKRISEFPQQQSETEDGEAESLIMEIKEEVKEDEESYTFQLVSE